MGESRLLLTTRTPPRTPATITTVIAAASGLSATALLEELDVEAAEVVEWTAEVVDEAADELADELDAALDEAEVATEELLVEVAEPAGVRLMS